MSTKISGRIFEGVGRVIDEGLSLNEKESIDQKTVSRRIKLISQPERLLNDLYRQIEENIPEQACSKSSEIWKCRRATHIVDDNYSKEKIIEKAVALLAEGDCMPGWHNQMPVASGIIGPNSDKHNNIDLIHQPKDGTCFRLVELKWCSDTPLYAMFEILRYGLVYLFFRAHVKRYEFECKEVMRARGVVLEVVAPQEFFEQHDQSAIYASLSPALNKLAREKIGEDFSMSLEARMFPPGFQCPFDSGEDVKNLCGGSALTPEGEKIRDAFENLVPVKWGDAGVKF